MQNRCNQNKRWKIYINTPTSHKKQVEDVSETNRMPRTLWSFGEFNICTHSNLHCLGTIIDQQNKFTQIITRQPGD